MRVPLQTGAAVFSWGELIVPLVIAFVFGVMLRQDVPKRDLGIRFCSATGGFYFLVFLLWTLSKQRRRASDIVFDARGVRIEGGPRDGDSYAWGRLRLEPCELVVDRSGTPAEKQSGRVAHKLMLAGNELAASFDDDEVESLRAVRDAIVAACKRESGDARLPELPLRTNVLACPSCGAAIAPVDADDVPCPFCEARVPIGLDARLRVLAARARQAESAREAAILERLLRQPGPRTTSMLVAFVVFGALAGAVVLGVALASRQMHWGLSLLILPMLAMPIAKLRVADRRAVRGVLLALGAQPAERPGGTSGCRCCGAPLPVNDRPFVRCSFCDAVNLLGIDLRTRFATDADQDLCSALSQRARARTEAMVGAIVFVVGALAAILPFAWIDTMRP